MLYIKISKRGQDLSPFFVKDGSEVQPAGSSKGFGVIGIGFPGLERVGGILKGKRS